MLHHLTLGHFDVEALKQRKLVVLRPLDQSVVTRLLREIGQLDESGHAKLDGYTVEVKEGYLVCPWLMPLRVQAAEEFAKRLHQETSCVIYDETRKDIVPLERMADW